MKLKTSGNHTSQISTGSKRRLKYGVRIKINTQNGIQLIPNESRQLGIWTKGWPADVIFDKVPVELRIVEIKQIEKIFIDVSQVEF